MAWLLTDKLTWAEIGLHRRSAQRWRLHDCGISHARPSPGGTASGDLAFFRPWSKSWFLGKCLSHCPTVFKKHCVIENKLRHPSPRTTCGLRPHGHVGHLIHNETSGQANILVVHMQSHGADSGRRSGMRAVGREVHDTQGIQHSTESQDHVSQEVTFDQHSRPFLNTDKMAPSPTRHRHCPQCL